MPGQEGSAPGGLPLSLGGAGILQAGQQAPGERGQPFGGLVPPDERGFQPPITDYGQILRPGDEAPGERAGVPGWSLGEQRQGVPGVGFPEGPLIQAPGVPQEALTGYPSGQIERGGELPPAEQFPGWMPAEQQAGVAGAGQFPDVATAGWLAGQQQAGITPAQEFPGGEQPLPGEESSGVAGATDAETERQEYTPPESLNAPKPVAPPSGQSPRDRAVQVFDKAGVIAYQKMSPAERV